MPRRRVFASISFRGPWKFLPSITGATEKKRKRGNIDVSTNKKPRVGTIDQKEAKRWPEAVVLPNVPMPIIWGTRSHQDGSPWTCTNCGNVNQPTRHLLVDLPAFNCVNCGKPSRVDFRFSFSNLAANGTCPVGKIKDQENTDLCAAFAVTMSVEISVRMRAVLSGVCPRRWPQLDPYCLLEFYIHTMEETPVSYEDIDFTSGSTLVQYARLATTTGIYDKDHENVYKATDIEFVGSDFETVCKHLANGFPLVTSIVTGDGFDDLNYSQIYKTRTLENLPEGHNVISHVVVLVGAGRSGTRDFYYFVNSYGEEFCLRGSDLKGDKIGGVGKIRASDIFALSIRFIR